MTPQQSFRVGLLSFSLLFFLVPVSAEAAFNFIPQSPGSFSGTPAGSYSYIYDLNCDTLYDPWCSPAGTSCDEVATNTGLSDTNAAWCTVRQEAQDACYHGFCDFGMGVTYVYQVTYTVYTDGGSSGCVGCDVYKHTPPPDLYAGSITPVSPIAGTPTTLTSNIYNGGTGTAGASNSNIFWVYQYGSFVAAPTTSASPLGPGGSQGQNVSYTFPSAGTYDVIFCVDQAGEVAESNEGNNCGPWTSITVGPAIPAAPSGLSASCNVNGTSATFTWNATPGATFYYFRNDDQQISSCGSWYCQDPPDVLPAVGTNSYTINGIVPGHMNSWWVHSANGSGYSAPTYSSIVCSGEIDLTADTPANISVTAGQAFTLSGTARNIGNAAAGSAPNSFDIFNTAWVAGNALTLPASGSGAVSASHTLSTPGSYSYRLCADLNTAGNGSVTESNEGNNCSAFATLTVNSATPQCSNGINDDGDAYTDYPNDPGCTGTTDTTESPNPLCSNGSDDDGDGAADYPADAGCSSITDTTESPNPPTASLSANPTLISAGSSATLTWSSSGATSCTGTGFNTGGATSGSVPTGVLTSTSNYSVSCTGAGGTSPNANATVTVINASAHIIAEPSLVSNGSTNLLWQATQSSSCTISSSQGGTVFSGTPSGATTTTAVSGITRQTTYTLSCTTLAGGTVNASALVNVRSNFDEF